MARKRRKKSFVSEAIDLIIWFLDLIIWFLNTFILKPIRFLEKNASPPQKKYYPRKETQAEKKRRLLYAKAKNLWEVDQMTGTNFEHYVATLLEANGFQVHHKGQSGDLGVDIVASKGENRYAIQIKRQGSNVSRRAVSDAVAGKALYNCNASAVITNNFFTKGARKLAEATNCLLIDRDHLAKMIINLQEGRKNENG